MYTEFLAATLEAHGNIEEERVAAAFDRLDSDDSGKYYEQVDVLSLLRHQVKKQISHGSCASKLFHRIHISRKPS